MSTLSKLTLAASAVLLSACATTATQYHMIATRTPAEVMDSSAAWASLDPDNDGSLTVAELDQQRAIGLLQDWPNADADHDGLVSKAEWDLWWPRMTDHYVREDSTPVPLADMAH